MASLAASLRSAPLAWVWSAFGILALGDQFESFLNAIGACFGLFRAFDPVDIFLFMGIREGGKAVGLLGVIR